MRLEYIGLSELSGSLIALEGVKDVAYDEMAEVTLENGERRYGRVILIDGDRVVLQVFEGTRGISLENASTHFTGKSMDIALSKEMLGGSLLSHCFHALTLKIAFNMSPSPMQGWWPSWGQKMANSPGRHFTSVSALAPGYFVTSFSSL